MCCLIKTWAANILAISFSGIYTHLLALREFGAVL
jgi:hypothetical protein